MIKLIDSSVWLEFLHRQGSATCQQAVASLVGRREAAYCGLIEFELLAGARTPRDEEYLHITFEICLRLEMKESLWGEAGHAQFQLSRKGKRVGLGDLLIATVARAHNVPVLTRDADFERIRDLIWNDLQVEKLI